MTYPLELDHLPAEILISIRLFLHTDPKKVMSSNRKYEDERLELESSSQSKSQLQLVNRRFRQLELDIPELWTHVDTERMDPDRIQLQLQRSKKLGLSLDLSIGRTSPWNLAFHHCICDRLAIVSVQAHRWTCCVVGVHKRPIVPNGGAEGEHLCFDMLQHASFPSVSFLEFEFVVEDVAPVIKTWSCENLKCLQIREFDNMDICPRYASSLDTLSWCTECHSFQESSFMKAFEPVALTLRCLRIDFFDVGCYGAPGAHLTLRSLKEFNLIDDSPEDHPERIVQLFQRISMPVLAKLSLKVHVSMCRTVDFLPWLRSLKNPELKSVVVVVAEAKHHAQFGDIIREVFIKEAKLEDRAVEVTIESDSEDKSEDDLEDEPEDNSEGESEDDSEDGSEDYLEVDTEVNTEDEETDDSD